MPAYVDSPDCVYFVAAATLYKSYDSLRGTSHMCFYMESWELLLSGTNENVGAHTLELDILLSL